MINIEALKKITTPPSHSLNVSRRANDLIAKLGPTARVLDLGCGTHRLAKHIINLDLQLNPEVDIVADASRLPFKDNSFDCVITQGVLYCISEPTVVISEIKRILKKGGYVYAELPFLQFYMPAPQDYYRCTIKGARYLFHDFVDIETGICVGPTSALLGIMRTYFAVLFDIPIISGIFYRLAGFLFAPLRFIDLVLVKRRRAETVAGAFYVTAKNEL